MVTSGRKRAARRGPCVGKAGKPHACRRDTTEVANIAGCGFTNKIFRSLALLYDNNLAYF
jgi:hypothetical protein